MKRTIGVILTIIMLFGLASCGLQADIKTGLTSSQEKSANNKPTSVVVYFSCTGNTKSVANKIAGATESDIFEIVPEKPYSSDDLNYNIKDCRANLEMNDISSRPAISSKIDVSEYDTVYIGYPIWWGTAPRIIDTFLESSNLSDKTVYAFCTSGGSGIETSISDMEETVPGLKIVSGQRFASGDSQEEIDQWVGSHK
jgi:flavodoxin